MITIDMITAALYSFMGLSALCVALTQVFKNIFKTEKRWQNHLICFLTSLVCCGIVLCLGIFGHMGIFEAFCTVCLSSWLMFAGIVLTCTGMANGMWSYDIAKQILELIGLLTHEPVPNKDEK